MTTPQRPDIGPCQRVTLDAVDAVELIGALEFCCDWFDGDRSRLDASLFRFCGGGYDLAALRGDLHRLADQISGRSPTRPARNPTPSTRPPGFSKVKD